jgi:uncharacterized protein
MQLMASFACGLLFGVGLLVSGMTQPAKVLGFLDIFGRWNPTLALVMAAALAVSGLGSSIVRRRPRPLLAERLHWPVKTEINRLLVIGSTLFGIGWGLAGLCPGPAIENLCSLSPRVAVFVLSMIAGMILKDRAKSHMPSATPAANAAFASPDG